MLPAQRGNGGQATPDNIVPLLLDLVLVRFQHALQLLEHEVRLFRGGSLDVEQRLYLAGRREIVAATKKAADRTEKAADTTLAGLWRSMRAQHAEQNNATLVPPREPKAR